MDDRMLVGNSSSSSTISFLCDGGGEAAATAVRYGAKLLGAKSLLPMKLVAFVVVYITTCK
jgi:hypothetical protein